MMSDSEDRSASELGPLPVELDTIEDLCKALEGEGVSEFQGLSAQFWPRNKGKLNTLHNGRTALSLAAQKGNLRVVEKLLDHGADVNAKDDGVQTAPLLAAEKGDCKIVETLLGHGDDVEAKYDRGRTALSYAAQRLHAKIVNLLLERGADPDERDDSQRTPASWVASTDRAPDQSRTKPVLIGESIAPPIDMCLGLLKERNANLHQPDKTGRTPISWAAQEGLVEMVEYLCEHCGNDELFTPDEDGRSPLSFAAQYQQYNAIAKLVKHKHNHNDSDKQCRTPLHWLYHPDRHKEDGYQRQPPRMTGTDLILGSLGFVKEIDDSYGCYVDLHGRHVDPKDYQPAEIINRSVRPGKTLSAYAVLEHDVGLVTALYKRVPDISPDDPNTDDGKTARVLALQRAMSCGQRDIINHPLFRGNASKALSAIIKL